jgi:hypothetical protein
MGSPLIAAWIAHGAFWGLTLWGWAVGALSATTVAIFLFLWFVASVGLPYIPYGAGLFSSYVAVLDIALVFIIFKGDVRLT